MKKLSLLLLISTLFLASCSNFQRILKSNDYEFKFNQAKEFYEKKEYNRAIQLFEDISSYFKQTEKEEDVLFYLSKSYAGQKDFYSAAENFKSYIRKFPKGKYAEESYFMIGYSSYLDSPDARLDQASTNDAIVAFSNFVESYPQSERTKQAYEYLTEMKDKLAYKSYLNAKTYYNLGSYLGRNCYASAVITASNALKIYTESKYRDDLMAIVLKSKHAQAVESIEEKKADRYRDVIDECYSYINEFPSGKYIKEAQAYLKEGKNYVNEK